MDGEQLNVTLLVATSVLLVAVVAIRLSARTGMPSLLVYLALGVLLGQTQFGSDFESVPY